jgi:hypothetical protein
MLVRRYAPFLGAAMLLASNLALAQFCDGYFPFEDSLADASGAGNDAIVISTDGQLMKPQWADGRVGRALHITNGSAVRSFLDLHYDRCPQVTIAAWIKLESVADPESQ